ncbi:hypothetical protein [Sphingobium yanoikuyae]|jgi:hypothetical protein
MGVRVEICDPPITVRSVEIRVGDEWIKHDFGREVGLNVARFRLLQMVDGLIPPPLNLAEIFQQVQRDRP